MPSPRSLTFGLAATSCLMVALGCKTFDLGSSHGNTTSSSPTSRDRDDASNEDDEVAVGEICQSSDLSFHMDCPADQRCSYARGTPHGELHCMPRIARGGQCTCINPDRDRICRGRNDCAEGLTCTYDGVCE
jgi:hypothetical protein